MGSETRFCKVFGHLRQQIPAIVRGHLIVRARRPLVLRRSRTISVLVLTTAVLLGACSSDSKTATANSSGGTASSSTPEVSGSVTVFAAASLTEPFNDEQTTLKSEQPGLSITYNFAGSGALVTQIQQGAPA